MDGRPLTFALAYASGGLPVLPLHSPVDGACSCRRADCASPAKHPRTVAGLSDASVDADQIRKWWTMWPDANVGIAIPAGYVVVDIDVEEASTATNGHDMPTTALAKTGRGWHFLYKTATPIRPAVGVLPHVDLRGVGSYIVAPPSRHVSGTDYVWVQTPGDGIADAPAWIAAAGRTPSPVAATPGEPILEGRRNDEMARLAGAMRHVGMTADEIAAALLAVNGARVAPPLPDDEVRDIAASVGRYAPGERGPRLVIGGKSTDLKATALADIEVREPLNLRLGRWDPIDHSILFGDGGTGKGVLVAYDVARLSCEGEVILILDYERHAEYEWRPRVEAFGGDLGQVFVAHPEVAIWDITEALLQIIDELDVGWLVVDSVAYACLGMEVEKSVTATRYSMAIAPLPCPTISLAHTTKTEVDPRHPFGSVFWSNGARITIGMSAPADDVRLLKNRKTNQRAPFPPFELDWSWSEGGTLPERLTERRAVLTLADRAWDALARGALTSESLLVAVNKDGAQATTLGSLKVMLSRSRRFTSTLTGWQRTPVSGAVQLVLGANDNSSETGSKGANGTANGNANGVPEAANEGANGTLTNRPVSSTPTPKGVTANGEPIRPPLKLTTDMDLVFPRKPS